MQVSAGQHLHLSGDMKNNVSVAAQQGIFFNQQHANKGQPPPNMNAGPGCNTNASNMNSNQQPHVQQPNNNPQSKHNTFTLLNFDKFVSHICVNKITNLMKCLLLLF